MKIGMEFRDRSISGIDFSNIEKGNPGCGGTQFEFALLAHHLLKLNKGYEIVFFHFSDNHFEKGSKSVKLNNLNDIPKAAKKENVDILLFWSAAHDEKWYEEICLCQVVSIAWAHNFLSYNEIQMLNKCPYVKRIVAVSKEQYELMCGEDVFDKCLYIQNMFDFVYQEYDREEAIRSNIVCCMGALIKAKGFHILAKQWKSILKAVPDAELYVFGTGNLWDKNASVGKYGLADAHYENKFMPYLVDDSGEILPSVHFYGNVGLEKKDFFQKTKVGVVNPNGIETFCIAALEMEAEGVPVCSKRSNGLLDSVSHGKTGMLHRHTLGMRRNIVKLLKNDELNIKLGEQAVEFAQHFHGDILVQRWDELFQALLQGEKNITPRITGNLFLRLKFLRLSVRFARSKLKLRFVPTPAFLNQTLYKAKGLAVKVRNRIVK